MCKSMSVALPAADNGTDEFLAVLGHVWYSTLVAWSSGRIGFDQVTAELDRAVRVLVEPYERRRA